MSKRKNEIRVHCGGLDAHQGTFASAAGERVRRPRSAPPENTKEARS